MAIFLCIGFAVVTGLLTGKLLKLFAVPEKEKADEVEFHDDAWWEVSSNTHTLDTRYR